MTHHPDTGATTTRRPSRARGGPQMTGRARVTA